MRWPRRGVVIRLLIYVPLIGFLGYQAAQKWSAERKANEAEAEAAPAPAETQDKLAPYKRVIELPDGTKQEIVELTDEQAHDLLGYPLPEGGLPKSEPAGTSDPAKPAPVATPKPEED